MNNAENSQFQKKDSPQRPVIINISDVTADAALHESEERFRQLAENIDEVFWLVSPEWEQIIYVSPAYEKIWGRYSKVLYEDPRAWIDAVVKEDRESVIAYLNKKAGGKLSEIKFPEFRIVQPDLSIKWILNYVKPVLNESGETVRIVVISRDITAEKEAKIALKRVESQLVQKQKLEAVGTLAGGIAHDFNNILQSIVINADLMLVAPDADEEERKDRVDNILKAARRARDLVKQILTFSRHGELELKPLQINAVLKESIKMLRSFLPTTIEIKQDISSGGDLVLADPVRIYQVIMNFATNAAYAMKEKGGVLTFQLDRENINAAKMTEYPGLKPGLYIKLSVSDTGHGIAPSIISKIFDPFFTTKSRGEGSGLGLAVAYGIARDLGGTITVESKLNVGSTFSFLLPRIESTVVEKPEQVQPLAVGKERILLVDDDKDLVHGNSEALRRLGYEVTAKYGSLEALESFKTEPEYFDLVITDQTMPKMTGSQMAKELIKIKPDVPIILCTGFSHSVSEEEAKEIGIKKFLMKPVLLKEMAKAVRDVLDMAHS
jgi:PAS domain S-box-containing protein